MRESVFVFPGQGAQQVGMGRDLVERYPAAARAFDVASEAAGLDLRAACFEGPAETLSRTDVCQPAILTLSIAVLRALEQAAGRPLVPMAAAGLSLGEYSALVAAGALDLADAVRLVKRRGELMQEACESSPGTMYSIIGLEDGRVEEACARVREEGGRAWPANYNSPGQLVISGEKEAAARAGELCKEMGARRVIELKVAGAFHSPLMQPAADRLATELERTPLGEPGFPVVANVTARPAAADEVRGLLARQLTSPVLWAQSMAWCIQEASGSFLELGPGKVLQGLLRRIDPAASCVSVCGADEVEGAAGGV